MMMAEDAARTVDVDFADLLHNLDRQSALYDHLLTLSEREREAIGQADLPRLVGLVAEKERVIAEAQTLEQQRETMCQRWAWQRGVADAPTLGAVQGWLASPEHAARLSAVAVELSARVSRLRQSNTRNAHILVQAQRMNEQVLAAAMRHARHPLYTHQGDTSADQRPSLLLDYRI
jgi:flagellar biosynthesis/type III secretory pathway chaperone